jgi:hypothetical protein
MEKKMWLSIGLVSMLVLPGFANKTNVLGPADLDAATMRAFMNRHDHQPRVEPSLIEVKSLGLACASKGCAKS